MSIRQPGLRTRRASRHIDMWTLRRRGVVAQAATGAATTMTIMDGIQGRGS